MKCRSFGLYAELLAMVLLTLFVAGIRFPGADNVEVGIVTGSGRADAVFEKLNGSASLFQFQKLEDEDELKRKVERGEFECGFVFAEDFDEKCEDRDITDSVRYYCSETTTKGSVIREILYAAILEVYSRAVLSDAEYKLYGENDEARMDRIMERFASYMDSDAVFDIEMNEVPASAGSAASAAGQTTILPLQGCVGIFVFLITFLYGAKRFESGYAYALVLKREEAFLFQLCGHLAAGTVPAAAGILLVLGAGQSRGIAEEAFRMLLLLISSALWGAIASKMFRNYVSFLAQLPGLVLVNLLLCPVFFDIVTYVRAMTYLRWAFPLGLYLG